MSDEDQTQDENEDSTDENSGTVIENAENVNIENGDHVDPAPPHGGGGGNPNVEEVPDEARVKDGSQE